MEKNIPDSASRYTNLINTFEAIKCGIFNKSDSNDNFKGTNSFEHRYARCKCCYPTDEIEILNENKFPVWSQKEYNFLKENYTSGNINVHPALWDNGMSNLLSGVFEVVSGKIYQVRGYDMANITFVKTNNVDTCELTENDHWLVMDTLMSQECTNAALECFSSFIKTTLKTSHYTLSGKISGIIISHSHVDHFGGMEVVYNYRCHNLIPIIAPEGFFKNAISENIYVGNAMERRASYQFGSFIKPSMMSDGYETYGNISIGIGQGQSIGTIGLMKPTIEIKQNVDEQNYVDYQIEDLIIFYQLTPGTEAPAEMNNYFPQYRALWLAENCTGTLHNLYAIRGAQVRDGSTWAQFLVETAELYGTKSDVIFQSHNWPHWRVMNVNGTEKVIDLKRFILETAAIYKYINDQTLLYINMGYKMNEVSDMVTLPKSMQNNWTIKPFYGTPSHNAKAVYQKYLGWYDANPLHLSELPPEVLAKETLRYMQDGSKSILDKIQSDYDAGNYWIAAYMAHQIVMGSEKKNEIKAAKILCSNALSQLGFQSQSGVWRNAYLCAAEELRNGKTRTSVSLEAPPSKATSKPGGNGMFGALTNEMLLDYISILFDGEIASANINYSGILKIVDNEKNITDSFYFHVINGSILYKAIEKTIKNEVNKSPLRENFVQECVVTRTQLMLLIAKAQGMIPNAVFSNQISLFPEILKQISACMINTKCDRFKYFDIMERHDSNVLIDNKLYDLREIAQEAIVFLNNKTPTDNMQINGWKKYYDILIKNSEVLLDADVFFTLTESSSGVSNEIFGEKEYYYTLWALSRYLLRNYLNLTTFLQQEKTESYIIISKAIRFLEEFTPYFYTNGDAIIIFDNTDKEMAKWFDSFASFPQIGTQLNAKNHFKILYQYYLILSEIIK